MTILMFALASCLFVSAQSEQTGAANGIFTTMTGCIAEKDGMYVMTSKNHPEGVQLMASDDMKPHVGHTMKVSGMMMKTDNSPAAATTGSAPTSMHKLKVSKMDMVSDHCESD